MATAGITTSKLEFDKIYIESKDVWTKNASDRELIKFYDVITNGKENLSVFFPTVWEN